MNYALKKRLRYSLGAFSKFTPSDYAIRLVHYIIPLYHYTLSKII